MSHDQFLCQQKILTGSYLQFPLEPSSVQVLSQHVWRFDSEGWEVKMPPHLPVCWPRLQKEIGSNLKRLRDAKKRSAHQTIFSIGVPWWLF